MITNKQLVAKLTERLNAFAGTVGGRNYQFYIHSNEGEFENAIKGTQKQLPTILINGVLLEQSSTPIPLKGLDSILLMQSLQVIIPCDEDKVTGRADYALQAINAFVADVTGNAGIITDESGNSYAYVLSVSTPFVGTENYFGQIGKAVPATLQVSWQLIKDGVLANNVNILIRANGAENPVTPVVLMDGAFVRTRTGDASNVDNAEEMKTQITQQGLTLKVVMPYKRGDASEMLYKDMLSGKLDRKYLVIYSDAVGKQGLSQNWVMVAREITASLTSGKGITVTATFEIAR